MHPAHACNALPIVLVDDEASFRTSLAEMLRDDGHEVRDCGAPGEMPPLESFDGTALLLADYEMPGKNGLDLADQFHACHPKIPVIVLTAYRFEALEAKATARPFLRLAQKPIDYTALHELIHQTAVGNGTKP
jgi:two-component system nitrogen regulation response regulator GlnG